LPAAFARIKQLIVVACLAATLFVSVHLLLMMGGSPEALRLADRIQKESGLGALFPPLYIASPVVLLLISAFLSPYEKR
jgi:hypothetical protein